MSNETVSKPRTRRSPAEDTSAAAERPAAEVSETTKKPVVPKEIDPNQIITVRNGFQGRLVYKSKRTGERWSWESFGAEQDMELSELKNARNSNKKYFINNWFMFDEDWVIDYLGMRQYYKNSLNIQDFDQLFKKPVGEIEDIISKLSEGQRKSVAYRAKQLIAEEEIDSNRVINTLEKCLGVELVER
jgi:hypothetical protein